MELVHRGGRGGRCSCVRGCGGRDRCGRAGSGYKVMLTDLSGQLATELGTLEVCYGVGPSSTRLTIEGCVKIF